MNMRFRPQSEEIFEDPDSNLRSQIQVPIVKSQRPKQEAGRRLNLTDQ
jgi:hypothetical protein